MKIHSMEKTLISNFVIINTRFILCKMVITLKTLIHTNLNIHTNNSHLPHPYKHTDTHTHKHTQTHSNKHTHFVTINTRFIFCKMVNTLRNLIHTNQNIHTHNYRLPHPYTHTQTHRYTYKQTTHTHIRIY